VVHIGGHRGLGVAADAARRSGGFILVMVSVHKLQIHEGRLNDARSPYAFPTEVPLAWRNILSDRRRLLRSTSGIAFAVLLILLQLGFRNAFLDSALQIIHQIDGDILLISKTKFRFGRKDPFPRRQLYAARAIKGVESVRPIYAEWLTSGWKNPQTHKIYNVQVLAFDPDQPVFLFPELREHLSQLKQPDRAFADSRARRFLGAAPTGTETELARRTVHIVGSISLGPDFTTDGTLITSDRTFMKIFSPRPLDKGEQADVEFGVIKVGQGRAIGDVQHALQRSVPNVAVLTKAELIELETKFQNSVSPVGPIFIVGTLIGFIVGTTITYQILYMDLSDNLPQYATLKAMGYDGAYLARVVLGQAMFYGLVGFVPALVSGIALYYFIGELARLPMHVTPGIALGTLALVVVMCLLSGLLAVRRVLAADPAEVF
jgi:putative ABC transport system permease protein